MPLAVAFDHQTVKNMGIRKGLVNVGPTITPQFRFIPVSLMISP